MQGPTQKPGRHQTAHDVQQCFGHEGLDDVVVTRAEKMASKVRRGKELNLEDFKEQLEQISRMGGLETLLDKLPGLPKGLEMQPQFDPRTIRRQIALISSMTRQERLRPDKTSQGLYFSETQMNFVCPWHGMEYDMKTGECISDRKMKLKSFKVVEKGDEVYVVA